MQDAYVADDASGRIAGVEAFAGPPVVKRDMRIAGTLLPPACVNLLLCTNENARIIFGLPLGQTCQSTGQIRGRSVTSLKGPSNAGIAEAELQARKRPVAGRSGGDGIKFPLPIWVAAWSQAHSDADGARRSSVYPQLSNTVSQETLPRLAGTSLRLDRSSVR